MRGVVIAAACLIAAALAAAAGLRVYPSRRPNRVLLPAFAAVLGLYAALFSILPADLGLLPPHLLEPAPAADFFNGLFLLAMVLHSFWCALYMGRGGLATVVERIERAGRAGETRARLQGGMGRILAGDAFLGRRLALLIRGGYLERLPRGARILPPGARYARLSGALRRAFGAGPGG